MGPPSLGAPQMTWANAGNASLRVAPGTLGRAAGREMTGTGRKGFISLRELPAVGRTADLENKLEGERCLESWWLNPHPRPLLSLPFCVLGMDEGPGKGS